MEPFAHGSAEFTTNGLASGKRTPKTLYGEVGGSLPEGLRRPILKPRWNLHLWGDEDWLGYPGGGLSPVLGELSGSAD